MVIWHYLSKSRLDQKIEFSRLNNGQLLFEAPVIEKDISNQVLGKYLYCLPNLVGGAIFCAESEMRAIRIDLKSNCKIKKFAGNPDELDFRELKLQADGLDIFIDAAPIWPIRFRQILIWNPDVILCWKHDKKIIEQDFVLEFNSLVAGDLTSHDFFLKDFTQQEQVAQAVVLANHLGIKLSFDLELKKAQNIIKQAMKRILAIK